ncbi:hypothetical protein B0H13DRAFT_2368344 [Mycena leptocephala]|nr:hypothetical protein B0H13DRAFT_2368344 [Mycena leptocephala]
MDRAVNLRIFPDRCTDSRLVQLDNTSSVGFGSSVHGLELNLASPLLQPKLSSGALDYCVTATSNLAAFTVGQTESGYAAVNGDMKYPATVTLLDEAFFSSTAGVLPLTFEGFDRNVSLWLPTMTTIPGTISPSVNFDNRLSSGYLMTQQGFTADVSCEFKNLTSDTTPSLVLETDTVNNATNGTQSSLPTSP